MTGSGSFRTAMVLMTAEEKEGGCHDPRLEHGPVGQDRGGRHEAIETKEVGGESL